MKTRVVLVALAIAAALVPTSPSSIERWYSTSAYLRLQSVVTPITNLVGIALLDLSIAIVLVVALVVTTRRVRSGGWRRAAVSTAISAVTLGASIYLVFLILWGLNYRRMPLEQKLDYERARVTRDAAVSLANAAATSLNAGHAAAHARSPDMAALEASFAGVQRALGAERTAVTGVPKRSALTWYFRRAAVDGMTDPWFLEIIVNSDVLDVERPFVIAHEWAHLAGYANESEANFVAWLTCLRGDALAQYSGWLAGYEHAAGALPRDLQRSLTRLDQGPRDDFKAIAARYGRSSPVVRRAARDVYDGYLKANRVPEGIGSYDAVLRLMLGTKFTATWQPTLAPSRIGLSESGWGMEFATGDAATRCGSCFLTAGEGGIELIQIAG